MEEKPKKVVFRFYEELNEFLEPRFRKRSFEHSFDGTPSVKDRIESLGVPHTEVDLVLVDGRPMGFGHLLHGGERVAVYPVFECFDIGEATAQSARPLREVLFVLDVHLGRLAGYLRLLGFDCAYRNDFDDAHIIEIARLEHRIVLTRDVGLLKNAAVTHGAFIHAIEPLLQVREVVDRFQLERDIQPGSRCMACNGPIQNVEKRDLEPGSVPADVLTRFEAFGRCTDCGRIYWQGSHFERMSRRLADIGIDLGAPRPDA